MLREHLQYLILQSLFDSRYACHYTFQGGSYLRIVYGTHRFSEDLHFDNADLAPTDFEATAALIQRFLELRGHKVALSFAYKGAYHCSIRFPGFLYDHGLSGHKEAKIMIKLDTEKQDFEYERELVPLKKKLGWIRIFSFPLSRSRCGRCTQFSRLLGHGGLDGLMVFLVFPIPRGDVALLRLYVHHTNHYIHYGNRRITRLLPCQNGYYRGVAFRAGYPGAEGCQ